MSKYLLYKLLPNDTYAVTGFTLDCPKNIIIPMEYRGKAITAIEECAFAESYIETLSAGMNLKVVRKSAFRDAKFLKSINFSGLRVIEERAFLGCEKIEVLQLPKSIERIGEKAFAYCTALEKVYFNTSMRIDADAFRGCEKIKYFDVGCIENFKKMEFENPYSNPLFYSKQLHQEGDFIARIIINKDKYSDYLLAGGDFVEIILNSSQINEKMFYNTHIIKLSFKKVLEMVLWNFYKNVQADKIWFQDEEYTFPELTDEIFEEIGILDPWAGAIPF